MILRIDSALCNSREKKGAIYHCNEFYCSFWLKTKTKQNKSRCKELKIHKKRLMQVYMSKNYKKLIGD